MTSDVFAIDTSVAIPALDPAHPFHALSRAAMAGRACALAGHAAFESYSVMTRSPVIGRIRPDEAEAALRLAFPIACWLSASGTQSLMEEFARLRIVGGSVFDALVGAAARENEMLLLTRDTRAERTYRALGVRYEVVG